MKSVRDTYTLNNDTKIPCVGYGTWQMPNDESGYEAVLYALKAGYRHIDTAQGYGNEEACGRAIKDSGLKREEIFLTTKLGNHSHGYQETLDAFAASLERLQTDYVDLYLIHWPNPLNIRPEFETVNAATWKAMEELYKAGKIKAIGVSNFRKHHLESTIKNGSVVPAVNQIRLCPGDVETDLVDYCVSKGILLQAYSPLGTGKVLEVEVVKEIAKKHKTSPAHVALAWNVKRGFQPLVKSVKPHRIDDNTKFFSVALDDDDMEKLNALDGVVGYSSNPDEVQW